MKKVLITMLIIAMVCALAVGCSPSSDTPSSSESSDSQAQGDGGGETLKVALVVNQRLGDGAVVDQMDAGAKQAAEEFGLDLKVLESESQADHEEDLRSMAQAGYNLIVTSFPPMSEATKMVAQEFPDVKFVAIYQFINAGDEPIDNVYSVEFQGHTAMFVQGYVAGLISQTDKLGFIIGGEEPGTSGEANGWMLGVASANPDATVEYANANNFEDPVKGKELATAMASNGVDIVHVIGSKTGMGVIEGAKESGIMADSDVNDYYDMYEGMIGYVGMGFDTATYDGIKDAVQGNFKGGQHGVADITNGGYFMDWTAYERYAEANPDMKDIVLAAVEKGKEVEAMVTSGEIEVPYDPDPSDYARAQENAITIP